MDPISASAFNLNVEESAKAIAEQKKTENHFNEIIVSCGSLSKYESSKFKTLLPQILATAISTSFHIVVGISLAYSAILLPQLKQEGSDLPITTSEGSWIASVIVLIVPAGGIIGGFLMDSMGRLNTLKLATIPSVIGWVLIAMATNVPMLIAGRLLTGLASALGTSPSIVYVTEIAKADMRGSLISFAPAYASLGMVLAYMKGWLLNWRLVAWLCNVYTIVPAILIMFIPESPAWLIAKGRVEQAGKSLAWLYRYHPQPAHKNETLAELHLKALQKEHSQKLAEQAAFQGSNKARKFKEFLKPTGYKPIFILFGLFFFQQFAGIYITLFHAVTFFKEMGSEVDPYVSSILIGVVRFCMSCINTYMLKRFKRRPLVMISSVGMAICMLLSGLMTTMIHNGTTTLTWVPCVLLLLYVITSMIGLLPIPWTMTAELFPIEIRGVAHSIAYSMANFLMFLSVQSYVTLNDFFGGAAGIQWFFAGVALCGGLYAFVFLPETHGKKLKDIEKYFVTNTIYLGSENKNKEQATKNIVRYSKVPGKEHEMAKEQSEKMIEKV